MPRRPPLAAPLLALTVATGCGSSSSRVVVTPVGTLGAQASATCARLTATLPQQVVPGARRRSTNPASVATAAWGNPPVTLRCGVGPANPLDDEYLIDGVRWATHDIGPARTWTTVGRTVNVVVTVPDAYGGQAELIGALAPAVSAATAPG